MSTAGARTSPPEPSHSVLVQRTVEACELAREAAAIAAEGIATGSMSRLDAIRQCEKELDAIDMEVDSGVTSTITRVPEAETRQLLACMKVMIGLERIGDLLLSFATSAQAVHLGIGAKHVDGFLDILLRERLPHIGQHFFQDRRHVGQVASVLRVEVASRRLRTGSETEQIGRAHV